MQSEGISTPALLSSEDKLDSSVPSPLTWRLALLCTLFTVLGVLWGMQVSLIGESVHLAGSVPAIPSLAALLLLTALSPLLRRWGVTRTEILLTALFVAIATAVTDSNCLIPYFFAFLVVSRYSPARENISASLTQNLPSYFAPNQPNAMRDFCEGHALVPWKIWLVPLIGWGLFFFAIWVTLFAVLRLFRDRWISHERLRFPIVDLMVSLGPEERGVTSFIKSKMLWAGVACSVAFNALNMMNAFDPGIPAPGVYIPLAPLLHAPPWNSLAPMSVSLRPEIFGIGYLMNTDVLFSGWFSYVLLRLSNVAVTMSGHEVRATPYDYQEIAAGAYLGVMLGLLWMGRSSFRLVWQQAKSALMRLPVGDPNAEHNRRNRRYASIALAGFLYQIGWAMAGGMAWWIAVLYLGLILVFAIVYSRIRAETGAPIWFLFPFWQQQKLLVNFLGTGLLGSSGSGSLAVLAVMGFLGRGTFPQLGAYHIEGMELASRLNVRTRHLAVVLLTALPFGMILSAILFLQISYHHGYYSIDGGANGNGGWRVFMAIQQFQDLASWKAKPTPPNLPLIAHTLFGGWLAVVMTALRAKYPGFLLHPLGLAMGASYGYHLWFPFLMIWVVKLLILKLGGAKLYRLFVPFFLGIVVGHYLMSGIVWGGISLFLPDLTRKFPVQFA